MWAELRAAALLTVLITAVPSFGLPAPSNVTVTCDSYGVVVNWTWTSDLKPDFILEITTNLRDKIPVINTTSHHFNISDQLVNTEYNIYIVEVKAKDGEKVSTTADSPRFSFSTYTTADVFCGLEFPPVILTPGDHNLTLTFANPLHLYRHTPALRDLKDSDTDYLRYHVLGEQNHTFICTLETKTCTAVVPFKEEREEYCVSFRGWIRQTAVIPEKAEAPCYHGSLKLGLPVTTYIIPVVVIFSFCLTILMVVFLLKAVIKTIKKKDRSKIPQFLFKIPISNLALKPESEPVVKNPLVEPAIKIPINNDSPGSTALLEPSANSSQSLDCSHHNIGKDDTGKDSEDGREVTYHYRNGTDVFSGDLSFGYDRPHGLIEMSPGDIVDCYGTRNSLFD